MVPQTTVIAKEVVENSHLLDIVCRYSQELPNILDRGHGTQEKNHKRLEGFGLSKLKDGDSIH